MHHMTSKDFRVIWTAVMVL